LKFVNQKINGCLIFEFRYKTFVAKNVSKELFVVESTSDIRQLIKLLYHRDELLTYDFNYTPLNSMKSHIFYHKSFGTDWVTNGPVTIMMFGIDDLFLNNNCFR